MKSRLKFLIFLSVVFSISGLAAGAAPTIDGTTIDPPNPVPGGYVAFYESANDDTGIVTQGVEIRQPDGTLYNNISGTFSEPYPTDVNGALLGNVSLGDFVPEGTWEARFYVYDDEGLEDEVYRSFDVGESSPTWTVNSPLDGDTFDYNVGQSGATVIYDGTVNVPNPGTLYIIRDDAGSGLGTPADIVHQETISSDGSYDYYYDEVLSEGDYHYDLVYESDVSGNTYNYADTSFSVNEVDNPPTLEDVTFDPSNPTVGQDVEMIVDATDDDQVERIIYDITKPNGNSGGSGSGTLENPSSDVTVTVDIPDPDIQGTYDVDVTVEDSAGQQDTQTFSYTAGAEAAPTFNLNNPSDGEEFTYSNTDSSKSITYDGSVTTDFSGTLRIIRDNTVIYSTSISSGTTDYSYTQSETEGNYTYAVEVESDTTGNIYQSNSRDFEVVQSEGNPPGFVIDSPQDGDTIYLNPGETSKDIELRGTVIANYSGTAYVWLNSPNNVLKTVSHSPDETNIIVRNVTVLEGNYSWNIYFESQDAPNPDINYSATPGEDYAINFTVENSSEPVPTQEIVEPRGIYQSNKFSEPIDFNAYVDSNFSALTTLSVEYPSGYSQQVDQISHGTQNNTFSGEFDLNELEVSGGNYTFKIITESDNTGNRYVTRRSFRISESPFFDYVRPTDDILLEERDRSYDATLFQTSLDYVLPGTIEYQLKEPTETTFDTIYSQKVLDYQRNVDVSFTHVVENIDLSEEINGTEYSKNYSVRAVYSPSGKSTDYSSLTFKYRYENLSPSGLEVVKAFMNDLLGEYGILILSSLLVLGFAMWAAIITDGSTTAVLVTSLVVTVTLTVIEWYPAFIGFVISVGEILLLSREVSNRNA